MNAFLLKQKKASAAGAEINSQDRGPAQAGRGRPAGRAGGALKIMEIAKTL